MIIPLLSFFFLTEDVCAELVLQFTSLQANMCIFEPVLASAHLQNQEVQHTVYNATQLCTENVGKLRLATDNDDEKGPFH